MSTMYFYFRELVFDLIAKDSTLRVEDHKLKPV